jgi:hypothetical protein
MYAALWRSLPGPPAAKAPQCLVLATAAVAFCFLWLFPRIAPYMPFNDGTVDTPTTGQTSRARTTTPARAPQSHTTSSTSPTSTTP